MNPRCGHSRRGPVSCQKKEDVVQFRHNRGERPAGEEAAFMEENRHPILDMVNKAGQFSYENGIQVTHVEPGLARGVLRAGPSSINPHGMIHGGAMAALADTVGGCCACSTGKSCVTANSTMEFLRPAQGDLFCEATPKKLGSKLSVIQIVITDTRGTVAATGTFTFFMAKPEQKIE